MMKYHDSLHISLKRDIFGKTKNNLGGEVVSPFF